MKANSQSPDDCQRRSKKYYVKHEKKSTRRKAADKNNSGVGSANQCTHEAGTQPRTRAEESMPTYKSIKSD